MFIWWTFEINLQLNLQLIVYDLRDFYSLKSLDKGLYGEYKCILVNP